MRILNGNLCKDCCFCIDDYEDNGLCCKDNIYKPIKLNHYACRYFCDDREDTSFYDNILDNNQYDQEEDIYTFI